MASSGRILHRYAPFLAILAIQLVLLWLTPGSNTTTTVQGPADQSTGSVGGGATLEQPAGTSGATGTAAASGGSSSVAAGATAATGSAGSATKATGATAGATKTATAAAGGTAAAATANQPVDALG